MAHADSKSPNRHGSNGLKALAAAFCVLSTLQLGCLKAVSYRPTRPLIVRLDAAGVERPDKPDEKGSGRGACEGAPDVAELTLALFEIQPLVFSRTPFERLPVYTSLVTAETAPQLELSVPDGPARLVFYARGGSLSTVAWEGLLPASEKPTFQPRPYVPPDPTTIVIGRHHLLAATAEALMTVADPNSQEGALDTDASLTRAVKCAELSTHYRSTAKAHTLWATALDALGKPREALEHYAAAAKLATSNLPIESSGTDTRPSHAAALLEHAHALRLLGEKDEARPIYQAASRSYDEMLRDVPLDQAAEDRVQRGIARHFAGQPGARDDFEAAEKSRNILAYSALLPFYMIYGDDPAFAHRVATSPIMASTSNAPYWKICDLALHVRRGKAIPPDLASEVRGMGACVEWLPDGPPAPSGSSQECPLVVASADSLGPSRAGAGDRLRILWPSVLSAAATGQMRFTPAQLSWSLPPTRKTELFFYDGLRLWGEGQTEKAKRAFARAAGEGVVGYIEYRMAREALYLMTGRALPSEGETP